MKYKLFHSTLSRALEPRALISLPFSAKSTLQLFKKFFSGVQLIYKVVLVSGIQQSDSVIYVCVYIVYTCSRILNVVLCAIE